MQMGRQITVLALWAEEKGASWNLGKGARFEEVHKGMGSSGGRGRFPAFQSPPTSLRCIQRGAEVGRWGGEG